MSTYTIRNNLEKIEDGSEVDSWGESERYTLDRLDEALDGVLSITVSGDRTLVVSATDSDELHYSVVNVTGGSGGRIIFPLRQARIVIRNGSTGSIVCTTNNSGSETTVLAGESAEIVCDGVNRVFSVSPNGNSTKKYVDDAEARAKAYTDNAAFTASSLPSQTGNAGKFIKSDGSAASWQNVQQSDVANLAADLTKIRNFAIAAAAIL